MTEITPIEALGDCAADPTAHCDPTNAADRAADEGMPPMSTTTTTRGHARDEWVDRTQAATLAGRHIDTIRRAQRTHQLTTKTGPNNTTLYNLGELVDVGAIPVSILDPEVAAREVADAHQVRAELGRLRQAHAELVGRFATHQETTDLLRAYVATQAAYIADLRAAGEVAR